MMKEMLLLEMYFSFNNIDINLQIYKKVILQTSYGEALLMILQK